MKLDFDPINVERSQNFEEESFSISDVSIVMDILRSKLYSNPIKVLVQEYMSNARDAHRELDKEGVPIEITCPTDLSPQFEVRDYGPGITPERMSNVFIKYAASTKRTDNKFTGGFGLGCKAGWSYSDTFHVVSITNETGVNVKRTYSCIVDESRLGKLIKMADDVTTDEPCGTRIIVPARRENYAQFRAYAYQTGYFWKVKPIIHGVAFKEPKTINVGVNWAYFDRDGIPEDFNDDKSFVIYDGIPYPLKTSTLTESVSNSVMKVLERSCIGLSFDVGDITISANREEIQYTEKTRATLANRVNEMVNDFSSKFATIIQTKPTFLDALISFNSICKDNDVIAQLIADKIEWNGIKIHQMDTIQSHGKAVKIERFFEERGVLKHKKSAYVSLDKHLIDTSALTSRLSSIYINDEPRRAAQLEKFKGFTLIVTL